MDAQSKNKKYLLLALWVLVSICGVFIFIPTGDLTLGSGDLSPAELIGLVISGASLIISVVSVTATIWLGVRADRRASNDRKS